MMFRNIKILIPFLFVVLIPAIAFGQGILPSKDFTPTTWQGCGTATASTSDVAIKAALTNAKIYVTSITCSSSAAATATNINFKDGSTVIAVGGVSQMAATADGAFSATFPVPLAVSKNTAFNFNTAVSTTSVICCGAGFISTI